MASVKEEKQLKLVLLHLEIDFVSHRARSRERCVNRYYLFIAGWKIYEFTSFPNELAQRETKKKPRLGFELRWLVPFPKMITVTVSTPL